MSYNNILKLFPQPVFKYQIENYKNINEELTKYIYELNKKGYLVSIFNEYKKQINNLSSFKTSNSLLYIF